MNDTDAPIVGKRHIRDDGHECLCGCQRVVGLTGEVIEAADIDGERLEIVRFMVPCPAGGSSKPQLVAYWRHEYARPLPARFGREYRRVRS